MIAFVIILRYNGRHWEKIRNGREGGAMDWLSDEILFYGGLIMAGVVLVILVVCLCASHVRLARLNARLDAEYGNASK